MRTLKLPNTDLRVSTLCYGSAWTGTVLRGKDLDRIMGCFRDAGGNFFDTAHAYSYWVEGGTGASELALADYFRRNGGRDEVVIATKGGVGSVSGYRQVEWYLSPGRIAADIDDSLGRLDIDTIDLYWLHRDDPRVPVGEIIEMLNAEVRRGRIRFLGASNWTTSRIAAANAFAADNGLRGFVASQPEWNLAHPNLETRDPTTHQLTDEDRVWHEQEKLPVIPYSPTAGGYFATDGNSGERAYENETSRQRLQRVQKLVKDLGYTPNQIALAYLMNHDFPVIPILGAKQVTHLQDAIGSTDIKLTRNHVTWLRNGN